MILATPAALIAAVATVARDVVIGNPGDRMAGDAHDFLGGLHLDHHGPDDTCEARDCLWCWRNIEMNASSAEVTYHDEDEVDDGLTWGMPRDDLPEIWAVNYDPLTDPDLEDP